MASPRVSAAGADRVTLSMTAGSLDPLVHAALSLLDVRLPSGNNPVRPVIDSQSDLFNPVMGALVVARIETTTDRIELSAGWRGAQIARDGDDAVLWVSQSDLASIQDGEAQGRAGIQLAALADGIAQILPDTFDPGPGAVDIGSVIVQQEPLFPLEARPDLAIGRMIDFFERAQSDPPLEMVVGSTSVELGLLLSVLAREGFTAPLASFLPGSPEFGEDQDLFQGGGADFVLYDPGTIGSGERVTGPLDPTELPQRPGFIDELRLPTGIPPVARDDAFTFATSTTLGNLLFDNGNGVDFDPDGNPISIQSVSFTNLPPGTSAATGSLAFQGAALRSRSFAELEFEDGSILIIRANGRIEFAPATDGTLPREPVEFTYRLRDATGLTGNRARVTIDFGDDPPQPIGAPLPADDEFTVNATSSVRAENLLLDNGAGPDSDPDGDGIEIVSARTAQDQEIAIGSEVALAGGTRVTVRADGTLLIDPSGLEPETDGLRETLRYRLIDDNGNESAREGLVTINVRAQDASIVPSLIVETVAVHSDTLDNLERLAELREAHQLAPEQRTAIDPAHFIIVRDAGDDSPTPLTFTAQPSRSAFDNVLLAFEIEEDGTAGTVRFVLVDDDRQPPAPAVEDLRPGAFGLVLVADVLEPSSIETAETIRLQTAAGAPLPLDGSGGAPVLALVDTSGKTTTLDPASIGGLYFATPSPEGLPSLRLNPGGRLQAIAGAGDNGTVTVGFEDTTRQSASQPDFNDLVVSIDFDVITRRISTREGPQIDTESDDTITSARIELAGDTRWDDDRLEIGEIDPAILVSRSEDGALLLSGASNASSYEQAFETIRLATEARVPQAGSRTALFSWVTADGEEGSETVSFVVRDVLSGSARDERIEVFSGDVDGRALSGRAGMDTLIGGAGSDILDGGRGDDNLFGAGGADILIGGRGADRFFVDDQDEIIDFQFGTDERIDVTRQAGAARLEQLLAGMDDVAS